jgi:hypothetical protein
MKLFLAAPASGLPSFDTALLSHVPGVCAAAEPIANAISKLASINRIICFLHLTGIPRRRPQEARGKTQEYNRDHEQAADDSELIVVHSADGNGAAIIFKPA